MCFNASPKPSTGMDDLPYIVHHLLCWRHWVKLISDPAQSGWCYILCGYYLVYAQRVGTNFYQTQLEFDKSIKALLDGLTLVYLWSFYCEADHTSIGIEPWCDLRTFKLEEIGFTFTITHSQSPDAYLIQPEFHHKPSNFFNSSFSELDKCPLDIALILGFQERIFLFETNVCCSKFLWPSRWMWRHQEKCRWQAPLMNHLDRIWLGLIQGLRVHLTIAI